MNKYFLQTLWVIILGATQSIFQINVVFFIIVLGLDALSYVYFLFQLRFNKEEIWFPLIWWKMYYKKLKP